MYIYNITIKVETGIEEDWLKWLSEVYIPDLLATECFEKHQLLLLEELEDEEGGTYALQLYAPNREQYDWFIQHYSGKFSKMNFDRWGSKTVSFSTIMRIVN